MSRGAYRLDQAANSPKTLGQRIRRIRLAWRWTQAHMAAELGSDQRTLSKWERDVTVPSGAALNGILGIFGISLEALVKGRGFFIPDPPRSLGGTRVAEPYAKNLVELPKASSPAGVTVLTRNGPAVENKSVAPAMIQRLAKDAIAKGVPVWLVIGE